MLRPYLCILMRDSNNPGLHRFAAFTAGCTLLLLVAGALVTSNDAGLSIPDWPTNYGAAVPPLVGGIRYEFTHRVIAAFVGLLTIILAVRFWREERRPSVRLFGLVALGAVVAQGILGGLTVLLMQPFVVSIGHATLAQLFFSTVCGLALVTSGWWQNASRQIEDPGSPKIRSLAVWTAAAIFLQLILGAAFRHKGSGIIPHLVGAAVVTALVFWTAGALRRRFVGIAAMTWCRRLLHTLIGVQLLLGGAALWSRMATRDFPQPMPVMVGLTVAHTVAGALTLAGAVLVVLVCRRVVRPAHAAVVAAPREVMSAGREGADSLVGSR